MTDQRPTTTTATEGQDACVPDTLIEQSGLCPDGLCESCNALKAHVIVLELKRERRFRVTPAQQRCIDRAATVPVVIARIVHPSTWPALLAEIDLAPAGSSAGQREDGT